MMKNKFLVPIVILLVAGMLFYVNITPPVPEGYEEFSAIEAQTQLSQTKNVRILDVRTPAEFNDGHIDGAKNIDFYARDFEEKLAQLDKDAHYFLYCRTGNRSSSTLKKMHALGFTKVWHLKDGIVDWKRAGLSLKR